MTRTGTNGFPSPALLGLLIVGSLLGGASPSAAQTILNTERFQLTEVSGFHASADLAFSLQRGNTELLDVSTAGIVGTLTGRHWPRVIFGGKYLSSEERSVLDQQFLQLRYSYILSPETETFHFVQAQKNETLLLRSRWLLGTGIRRALVRSDRVSFAVGSGLMGEWERRDPEAIGPQDRIEQDAVRIANLAVLSVDLAGGGRILNILYLQPDLTRLADARILNDLALLVPLSDRLRTTMSVEWRRDTRPPSTLGRDDLTLKAGFALEFH